MWRIDCKTAVLSASSQSDFKVRPVLPVSSIRNLLNPLLGDPSVENSSMLLTEHDILVFLDGRVKGNSAHFTRECTKRQKARKSFYPSRPTILRLLYDNSEFDPCGGYAAPRRRTGTLSTTAAATPEPLESLTLIKPKSLSVPERARKWVSLPGTSTGRGWFQCRMKGEEDRQLCTVSADAYLSLLSTSQSSPLAASKASKESKPSKAQDDEEQEDDEEEDAAEEEEDDGAALRRTRVIHPWEAAENINREIMNCFSPSIAKFCVIDVFAGYTSALGACRDRVSYVGYCTNESHRALLYEMLLMKITLEMVLSAGGETFSSSLGWI